MRTVIRIANPVQDGKQYTSAKRARHFIRAGRAELTDDGQLFFFTAETMVRRQQEEREAELLERHRKGILYWNGSADPLAMHRPGECRS